MNAGSMNNLLESEGLKSPRSLIAKSGNKDQVTGSNLKKRRFRQLERYDIFDDQIQNNEAQNLKNQK